MSPNKDLRALLKRVRKAGCAVEATRNGHVRVITPSGEAVVTGSTPSCPRATKNFVAQLRRAGVQL